MPEFFGYLKVGSDNLIRIFNVIDMLTGKAVIGASGNVTVYQPEDIQVINEIAGTSSLGVLNGTLAHAPVQKGTVSLFDTVNYYGDINGTLYQLPIGLSPFSPTQVINEDVGVATGGALLSNLANPMVIPGTIIVTVAIGTGSQAVTLEDPSGSGNLTATTGSGSGTIGYTTGSLNLTGLSGNGEVTVTYRYTSTANLAGGQSFAGQSFSSQDQFNNGLFVPPAAPAAGSINYTTGVFTLNTANPSCLVTAQYQYSANVNVPGVTWPLTLSYVQGSNGDYFAVIPASVQLEEDQTYFVAISMESNIQQVANLTFRALAKIPNLL